MNVAVIVEFAMYVTLAGVALGFTFAKAYDWSEGRRARKMAKRFAAFKRS